MTYTASTRVTKLYLNGAALTLAWDNLCYSPFSIGNVTRGYIGR
jgi:hypothetical protein